MNRGDGDNSGTIQCAAGKVIRTQTDGHRPHSKSLDSKSISNQFQKLLLLRCCLLVTLLLLTIFLNHKLKTLTLNVITQLLLLCRQPKLC